VGYTAVLIVLLIAHLAADAGTRKIACICIRRLELLQRRQVKAV